MQKPDSTGEWILNLETSALSPVVAPAVQSGFVRIEHREPTVSVHLSITMDGKPFEVRFERPQFDVFAVNGCTKFVRAELDLPRARHLQSAGGRYPATPTR